MVNGPSKVAIYVGKAPHNPQHAVQRSPRNVTRNHNRSNPIKRLTTIHDSVIAAFFQTPRAPSTSPLAFHFPQFPILVLVSLPRSTSHGSHRPFDQFLLEGAPEDLSAVVFLCRFRSFSSLFSVICCFYCLFRGFLCGLLGI